MFDTLSLFLFLSITLCSLFFLRSSVGVPYGLYHLTLNKELGDSDSSPKTEWMNQGYWKATTSFPEACRALALKLLKAAKYKVGDSVLDVGHGTGESLIMFLTDRDIPRPSKLVGITNAPSQYQRSKERVSRVRSSNDEAAKVSVDLYCGDAICRDTAPPTHPLHVQNTARFDVVFALDCAYHFATRKEFLAQAYQKLAPGGRIVLGDICFAKEFPSRVIAFIATKIMPKENIVSPQEYIQLLEKLGYTEVELEDITSDSFVGLCKFLSTRGALWYIYSCFLSWFQDAGGARFVVVTARKP
ncbi:hypothetical protein AGABI2DRAFT_114140 [Agaricus bisporus var. bisporus H97]|uniref:hypothetical protein n=1 Tax=Agaricus bisporus var. bisporus (strain H97 / ATCC MYA-4626 / FGSC 10389) TaxID=936046 RepID=UPI00029F6813|nr:hypothetical protein AGABI2DRAFT_114140 [Agaricus bisporus var. bisporus H97]EKV51408.1 hypothetical protein AGABI2DRAFT_114140 [Agaricus bisporus var. bisporus H97]